MSFKPKPQASVKLNQEQPPLFKNKWLEKLTYTSPAAIISLYAVVTITFFWYYSSSVNPAASAAYMAKWYLIGLASWSLGEYVLHRFMYHDIKDASYNKGFHYLFHGIHHEYPNDTKRIILPPLPSLVIASLIFGLVYGLFWLFTGSGDLAFLYSPGFVNGYVAYMLVHYTVHKVPSPKKFNFWWRHHNIHHFQQHDRAFGVTSPLWDIVFRTMPEKGRKTTVEH